MSCDYFPEKPIPFNNLKNVQGIQVHTTSESTARNAVVLFDGENYVWAFKTSSGHAQFTSFGLNDESRIISLLEEHFQTSLPSEHEVGRWREELTSTE